MMEFAVFFLIPFDENTPSGHGDAVVEHVKKLKKLSKRRVWQKICHTLLLLTMLGFEKPFICSGPSDGSSSLSCCSER